MYHLNLASGQRVSYKFISFNNKLDVTLESKPKDVPCFIHVEEVSTDTFCDSYSWFVLEYFRKNLVCRYKSLSDDENGSLL